MKSAFPSLYKTVICALLTLSILPSTVTKNNNKNNKTKRKSHDVYSLPDDVYVVECNIVMVIAVELYSAVSLARVRKLRSMKSFISVIFAYFNVKSCVTVQR